MQSRRYSYEEPYSVLERRHLATCCTARLWVENFVGGKFRDLSMSHENNENWHPTKITRYTVYITDCISIIPGETGECVWRQRGKMGVESPCM